MLYSSPNYVSQEDPKYTSFVKATVNTVVMTVTTPLFKKLEVAVICQLRVQVEKSCSWKIR